MSDSGKVSQSQSLAHSGKVSQTLVVWGGGGRGGVEVEYPGGWREVIRRCGLRIYMYT